MQTALERNDGDAFLDADLAFHTAIAEASQNMVLVSMSASFVSPLREFVKSVLETPGSAESALLAHSEIAEAIWAKDGDRASQAMESHLEQVGRVMLGLG